MHATFSAKHIEGVSRKTENNPLEEQYRTIAKQWPALLKLNWIGLEESGPINAQWAAVFGHCSGIVNGCNEFIHSSMSIQHLLNTLRTNLKLHVIKIILMDLDFYCSVAVVDGEFEECALPPQVTKTYSNQSINDLFNSRFGIFCPTLPPNESGLC